MKQLLAILASVFVLGVNTNAFAYRSMGCDSTAPRIDRCAGSGDYRCPTDNPSQDSQNQEVASYCDADRSGWRHSHHHHHHHHWHHRHHPHHDCVNPCPAPDNPADDDPIPDIPADDPSDDGSIPDIPADDPADDGSIPDIPADDPADDGSIPDIPADDPADDGSIPDIPADDPSDDGTVPDAPADDPADETPDFAPGTLTLYGAGFGGSAGNLIGIICLPADTVVEPSIVSRIGSLAEGIMAGMIDMDGSILNILNGSGSLTLINLSFSGEANLSGGDHIVTAIIDKPPAMMDFVGFSDLGDNDLVAITKVQIDGDTEMDLDYDALTWIPFGDF